MPGRAALFLACSCIGACTATTSSSVPVSETSEAFALVQRQGARRPARIQTRDSLLVGPRVGITPTSLLLWSASTDTTVLDLAEVRSIEFRSGASGAAQGVGFGLLAAFVGGTIAAVIEDPSFLGNLAVPAWTIAFAIVTVPVGAIIGAKRGHRVRVELGPARR
jgi:hypothetical protein